MTNDSTPKFLYRNLGNGKFEEIGFESGTALSNEGSEQASMGIAVGDYNHTGRPSLFVNNFENENPDLYRNDGDWNFTEVSFSSGVAMSALPWVKWGTAFVDLDNDGWLDLITVDGHVYPQMDQIPSDPGYLQPKVLDMNQGDGNFCNASDQAGPASKKSKFHAASLSGIFSTTGIWTLSSTISMASPMILRNNGVPGRHWVSFELAGTKSNRLALNARIKIVAGGMTQTSRDPQRRKLSIAERSAPAFRSRLGHQDRQR